MAVQGARKELQLIRQGVLAFAAVVQRAAFDAQKFPSDIQVFLAGCPVMRRTDFVGLAEQGTLPAKDWMPLAICGDGRTTCMACKEAAGICSGESGITAIRWGGLTCGGLYRETTVACKFERSTF